MEGVWYSIWWVGVGLLVAALVLGRGGSGEGFLPTAPSTSDPLGWLWIWYLQGSILLSSVSKSSGLPTAALGLQGALTNYSRCSRYSGMAQDIGSSGEFTDY